MTITSNRDCVLLTGQSNLNGWFERAELYGEYGGRQSGVIWTAQPSVMTWSAVRPIECPYSPPGDIYPHNVGCLALPLARHLKNLGWHPAIAQYGAGGTTMYEYWKPSAEESGYPVWSAAIHDNWALLTSSRLRAWIMYQGEWDAANLTYANAWADGMTECAAAIRTLFSSPTLPIVVVQIPLGSGYTYLTELRESQAAYVASDPHSALVDSGMAVLLGGAGAAGHVSCATHILIAAGIETALKWLKA